MGKLFLFAISLFSFVLFPCFSQEELDLDFDTYLNLYKEQSINYQKTKLSYEQTLRDYNNRYNFLYPNITLSAGLSNVGLSFVQTERVPDANNKYTMGTFPSDISSSIRAGIGFNLNVNSFFTYKKDKYNMDLETQNYINTEVQLEREAIDSYYQVMIAKEDLDLTSQSLQSSERIFANTSNDYNAGEQSYSNYSMALISLRQERQNFAQKQREYERALSNLLKGINLDPNIELNFINDIDQRIQDIGLELNNLEDEAQLIELNSKTENELNLLLQEENVKLLELGLYVPQINLSLDFGASTAWNIPYDIEAKKYTTKNSFAPGLDLGASLNLSFNFSDLIFLTDKKLELKVAKENLILTKQEIALNQDTSEEDYERKLEDLQVLIDVLNEAEQNLDLQTNLVSILSDQYSRGLISYDDLEREQERFDTMNLDILENKKNIIILYLEIISLSN